MAWQLIATLGGGGGGGGASAGDSPAYGWVYNPTTGRLTLETVAPDSGETFESWRYNEVFVGLGDVTFSWSATKPSHLMAGLD